MKKNDIGIRLKEVRGILGLNQKDFSDLLRIRQNYLSRYENGEHEFSDEMKLLLIEVVKETYEKRINIDWLLTGEGEMFALPISFPLKNELTEQPHSQKVPLLRQKVSCGPGINWEDEQNIKAYVDIFALVSHLKPMRMFALSVQGNSMVGAGIKNGDYVLFNAGGDQYLDDGIYVFALDGEVYCKLLEFDRISGKIKIYSVRVADLEKADLLTTLNREDIDFVDRFTIFGRVVSWVHPNTE